MLTTKMKKHSVAYDHKLYSYIIKFKKRKILSNILLYFWKRSQWQNGWKCGTHLKDKFELNVARLMTVYVSWYDNALLSC